LAYFVGASRVESRDHGLFYLYAGTHAGAAETVASEMRAELERLAGGKFKDGEVAMAKLRLRVARRQGRQAASARMQGAMLREVAGLGANYDEVWEARLDATGDNEVAAFVRDYLQPKFEQSVTLLPKA
jgi:predicted Zn-dependent peptidase